MPPLSESPIVCVGEVLWDSLPLGLFLGGAPFNVGYHLHALGRPVAMVSRVGTDVLGREVRRRARWKGMRTDWIQTDPAHPTGFVEVSLDAGGEPEYEIVAPAAWDRIAWTEELGALTDRAEHVVFGTLAQRDAAARETVRRLLRSDVTAVYDVNLRPPYDERSLVRASLVRADWIKLNADELARLGRWFDHPEGLEEGARALSRSFSASVVCVTRGSEGAALLRDGRWVCRPGFEVEVEDAVGAGDAFLAVLVDGLIADVPGSDLLDRANRLGAYVATQMGATPEHDPDEIGALSVSD